MKIAYITDSATTLDKKHQDLYVVPFTAYNNSGTQHYVYDAKYINKLQEESGHGSKLYIEPTPGLYRDLFLTLKKQGYEAIVCIPQNREQSLSYKNAIYATKITDMMINVIDVNKLSITPETALTHLFNDNDFRDEIKNISLDLETILSFIQNSLNRLNLTQA